MFLINAMLPSISGAVAAPGGGTGAEPDEKALITEVQGTVEVKPATREWFEASKLPVEIRPGDRVHTYGDSKAVVSFHEESSAELSDFAIAVFERAKFDHVVLRLTQGAMTASISYRARRTFEARVGGASVRGTKPAQIRLRVDSAGDGAIEILSGEVSVRDQGLTVTLGEGRRIMLESGRLGAVAPFKSAPADAAVEKPGPPSEASQLEALQPAGPPDEGPRPPPAPAPPREARRPMAEFRATLEREFARTVARDAVESAAAEELRLSQLQEGRTFIDAFGLRVRVEEYVTRPDSRSFKLVALNHRQNRFDTSELTVSVNKDLPEDLSGIGDLYYRAGGGKPEFYAEKLRWTVSNDRDSMTRLFVDGDSRGVDITPEAVFNAAAQRFEAPVKLAAFQTVFGNVYEFLNGGGGGIDRIHSDAAFRPLDNGVTAGTPVIGMTWHMQPVEVRVRDQAVPGTSLAVYWGYAFLSRVPTDLGGTMTGLTFLETLSAPDPFSARYVEQLDYINFRDSNGNGILDFPEPVEAGAGCRYGSCAVANVFHDRMNRLNGTALVALAGAGCLGTAALCLTNAGDTQFFSDSNGDGLIGGAEPQVAGVTGPSDAALLAFAAANPRAWLKAEHYAVDDLGKVAATAFARPSGADTARVNEGVRVLLKGSFERVLTSSAFADRKIDLALTPGAFFNSGLLAAETDSREVPAAGAGDIPQ